MRLLMLFASLAALSASVPPALAQQGDTLRIGVADDPDILDPTFSRTYVGTVVMTALCDKLFDFAAKLNIVPVLAASYEWADDRTLLIRLRAGVQFQNGEKFEAEAVKYSLERHLNASGSFRSSEIGAMDHVEVVDPLTVRVVMKRPFSPFVAILTDRAGMMLPPKATEAGGKDFGLHPVCTGPFRFVERIAQDHITLERFPGYWDAARIHYGRVTYRIIPDSSIRLANLRTGALDLTAIAPLDAESVTRDPKLTVVSVPSLGYGALTINAGNAPKADNPLGRDPRVRHAFELALDREALIQVVFAGKYQPNAQATSAISPLYVEEVAPTKRDVTKARALLKEAGVTTPLTVPLVVYNTPAGVQTGEVIQSMAAEAGFAVQVQAMEFEYSTSDGAARRLCRHTRRLVRSPGYRQQRMEFPPFWRRVESGGVRELPCGRTAGSCAYCQQHPRTPRSVRRCLAAGEQGSADHLPMDAAQHHWPEQEGGRIHAARRRTAASAGRTSSTMRRTTGGQQRQAP